MSLLTIIVVLVIVGVLLYLLNNYIPMDRKIKSIINIVIVIAVVIWLLQSFHIIGSLSNLHIS